MSSVYPKDPSMNWHFLDFSRDTFEYKGQIDDVKHRKYGSLGETAIVDLWLLSHGQVFVGHMGSRLCKVAWLLATARHNTFVPFRTVDGHSFCANIKPYIDSMENCMTLVDELTGRK